jgi:hypothetical protein
MPRKHLLSNSGSSKRLMKAGDMAVRLVTMKCGKEAVQLNDNENRYDKESSSGDYLFWRCTRSACSARLWTDSDPKRSNPQLRGEHNHEPWNKLKQRRSIRHDDYI